MPWDTDDSTGFLNNFTGTVIDAYFNEDANYQEGALLLYLDCQVNEIHQEWEGDLPRNDDDDPTVTVSFAVGKGWESEDNDTATHPKRDQFHASSIYGRILDAITGKVLNYGPQASRTDGEELVCDFGDLIETLKERGDPRDAKVWEGLCLRFAEVHIDFGPDKAKGGDARMTTTRPFPIQWLPDGVDVAETKTEAKSKAKPKSATKAKADPKAEAKAKIEARAKAKAAAKAKASSSGPFAEVKDSALVEQLQELLDGAEDFNAWLDAVVELDAVATDDELLQHLIDVDNGPWASKA